MQIKDGAKVFIKNIKTGKFLFILRDNIPTIPYPNCWSIVGGGIEEGETPLEALKREISEEVNVNIINIEFIESRNVIFKLGESIQKAKGYLYIAYTRDRQGELEVYEGQKGKYFSLEEIKKAKNTSPALKKTIEKYIDRLSKN